MCLHKTVLQKLADNAGNIPADLLLSDSGACVMRLMKPPFPGAGSVDPVLVRAGTTSARAESGVAAIALGLRSVAFLATITLVREHQTFIHLRRQGTL